MQGTDTVRRCDQCRLNVYNLSAMTRDEAIATIVAHEGMLCVSICRRSDGTILTRDCPVGLQRLRQRLARMVAYTAAMVAALAAAGWFLKAKGSYFPTISYHARTLLAEFADWIDPFANNVRGAICIQPPASVSLPQSVPDK
jgi:hypothetical protein